MGGCTSECMVMNKKCVGLRDEVSMPRLAAEGRDSRDSVRLLVGHVGRAAVRPRIPAPQQGVLVDAHIKVPKAP